MPRTCSAISLPLQPRPGTADTLRNEITEPGSKMTSKQASGKPDILMIVSDQHNASITGCYGDRLVKTPHIDRLAADGVLFERAYCPYPVCGPSRMSFKTGRYPYDIECWNNGSSLASDIPTFAHALGIAGYEVALDGRAHWIGPDQRHGFESRLVGDISESPTLAARTT